MGIIKAILCWIFNQNGSFRKISSGLWPWAILGRFVGRQLGTFVAQMEFKDEALEKHLIISGSLDTKVAANRGSARTAKPWWSDLYNVIYGRCILRRLVSPNTLILNLGSS